MAITVSPRSNLFLPLAYVLNWLDRARSTRARVTFHSGSVLIRVGYATVLDKNVENLRAAFLAKGVAAARRR